MTKWDIVSIPLWAATALLAFGAIGLTGEMLQSPSPVTDKEVRDIFVTLLLTAVFAYMAAWVMG